MRKIKFISIIILLIISLYFGREFYRDKSKENHYIDLIGLNIPDQSVIIEFSDTHGGFHGDGTYYEVIQLEKEIVDAFTEHALGTGSWGRLPMRKELQKFIHGENGKDYSYGGYGEMMPDDITRGLYYFKDRYQHGAIFLIDFRRISPLLC